ncbi:CARDB domain-containing protein [Pelagibius sp.]|uniref:CARDB domain-containing protein n=1 Tax=Pelagibius sp. TaxID=1931238 RepID=UPI0026127B74|nr:CARDB domain-containing protein [Pelagibius sp.]
MRIVTSALLGALALASMDAALAQSRLQPSTPKPPAPELQLKAPASLPDLVVIKAVRGPDYSNGQGRIFLQIKNTGTAAVGKSQGLATHDNNVGCGTYFMVPALAPGAVSSHTIRYCEDVPKGTRIRVIADQTKKHAESDETNNRLFFNW